MLVDDEEEEEDSNKVATKKQLVYITDLTRASMRLHTTHSCQPRITIRAGQKMGDEKNIRKFGENEIHNLSEGV